MTSRATIRHSPHRHPRGFTLLEVLVALIILSVGLLGLANLQILGLRSSQGAFQRSQATILAEEMAERMQANVNPIDAFVDLASDGDNDNDDAYTINSPFADPMGVVRSTNVNCGIRPAPFCSSRYNGGAQVLPPVDCTPAQMATFDFYNLVCGVDGSLNAGGISAMPGGEATLVCNDADAATGHPDGMCVDGSTHTITIRWNEIDPQSGEMLEGDDRPTLQYTFVP